MFSRILEAKKKKKRKNVQRVLVRNLVKISLKSSLFLFNLKSVKQGLLPFRARGFCPYVHVNITLKFYRTLRVHTEPFYILRYSHGTVEQ